MCFDTAVRSLALDLDSSVVFGGQNPEACEIASAYKHPRNSRVNRWIDGEAKVLYSAAAELNIEPQLNRIGGCKQTRLSALREAIRWLAREACDDEEIDNELDIEVDESNFDEVLVPA